MDIDVTVVVPFTSTEPWRVRARDHVLGWYRRAGWETIEGRCATPWCKAAAVADAVSRSAGDILVVADADCLCSGVGEAVEAVAAGAGWAVPHGLVHRLDAAATEAVYAGVAPEDTAGCTQRPYRGWPGGGIVVVPRETWGRIPIDPRFVGWGQEDESWAAALATLVGPAVRGGADLHHLWHPPADRMTRRWGSASGRALATRYWNATRDPAAMEALIGEARDLLAVEVPA